MSHFESERAWWRDHFDRMDREAGIVRVDTRNPDPAQVERVQVVLTETLAAWDISSDYAPDASVLLAALADQP